MGWLYCQKFNLLELNGRVKAGEKTTQSEKIRYIFAKLDDQLLENKKLEVSDTVFMELEAGNRWNNFFFSPDNLLNELTEELIAEVGKEEAEQIMTSIIRRLENEVNAGKQVELFSQLVEITTNNEFAKLSSVMRDKFVEHANSRLEENGFTEALRFQYEESVDKIVLVFTPNNLNEISMVEAYLNQAKRI